MIKDFLLGKIPFNGEHVVYEGVEIKYSFIDYVISDKSRYASASSINLIDLDNDFLIDRNENLLMKIDFMFINTEVFTKAADHFREHKCYTFAERGSQEYKAFYRQETIRRKRGMTAKCKLYFKDVPEYFDPNAPEERKKELLHDLRITGDHYNFLNYTRMMRTRTREEELDAIKRGLRKGKKIKDFPRFIDGQYWEHKTDEFCINNGLNLVETKARRKGFTYSKASHSSNTVNLYKDTSILNLAFDIKYLTDANALSHMIKANLDWLESNTYWSRGYLKEDLANIQLGYKKQKEGSKKFGWGSSVLSYATNRNESVGVGKDGAEINYEESGKFANLEDTVNITNSSIEDGDLVSGIQRMFGTGGTKDANWLDFSKFYYKPKTFNGVSFANVWDDNSIDTAAGFFYPQVWAYFPYVDEFGNSDIIKAYHIDTLKKIAYAKENSATKTNIFIGQRANRPSEAFLNTNENIFTHKALTRKLRTIQNPDTVFTYRDGWIEYNEDNKPEFVSNLTRMTNNESLYEYLLSDIPNVDKGVKGADRIFYSPYRDTNDDIPKEMSITVYDPYGIDKDKKELTNKHSLASIQVWGLPNKHFPNYGFRLLHSYCGRLDTMEEMDLKALAITEYYGSLLVAELDRGTCLATAKKYKKTKLLANDISYYTDPKGKGSNQKGIVVGSYEKKAELLTSFADMLYEKISIDEDENIYYNIDNLNDLPLLLELANFKTGKNSDRISSAILAVPYMRYYQTKMFNAGYTKDSAKSTIANKTHRKRLAELFKN